MSTDDDDDEYVDLSDDEIIVEDDDDDLSDLYPGRLNTYIQNFYLNHWFFFY